jgi:arylsulfatase A-like enzyme
MNVILIMSDSFRRDNLSCYGQGRARTPRLDRFAQEAVIFDNAYLGSFPTIPNRLDLTSGRFSFIDHEWSPLPTETITLQQVLSASGVMTQLICDNPHMIETGFNYERGFDGWEWIRGQESDRWLTSPPEPRMPDGHGKNRSLWILRTYLRNTSWWQGEEDHFVARSIREACSWLERNQDQEKFFLHVDLFDPHEPWDAPQYYVDLYDPDYQGPEVIFPHYEYWRDFLTQEELDHVRAEYLAEATMVDHWIGVLLDRLDDLGMSEDTAVIFTSDHGYLFGEHGLTGKSRMPIVDETMFYEAVPMYADLRRVPLLVRVPGIPGGQHIEALVQSPDLMPTVLELAGLVATETRGSKSQMRALQRGVLFTSKWQLDPAALHGQSLMPLLNGDASRLRDIAVCSNTLIHHTPLLAKCAIVTEDGWCLHYAGRYQHEQQGATLSITKLVDPAAARVSTAPMLFNLRDDPREEHDVFSDHPGLAREIHERYVAWLESMGTPLSHLEGRRRLN